MCYCLISGRSTLRPYKRKRIMIDVERIDWDAVVDYLHSCISNEQAFANGSSRCECAMFEGNILRMEAEIEDIEEGFYDSVIDYYGEEFFEDFMEE